MATGRAGLQGWPGPGREVSPAQCLHAQTLLSSHSPDNKGKRARKKERRKKKKKRKRSKHCPPRKRTQPTNPIPRFSASSPRPSQPLDMIKFICKDLWTLVFRKQIDNLKTNHRGTFVLTDARFQALARMSVDRARGSKGLEEALTKAQAVRVILEFFFLFSFSLLFCSCYRLPCVCVCVLLRVARQERERNAWNARKTTMTTTTTTMC